MDKNNQTTEAIVDPKLKALAEAKGIKLGFLISELKIDEETRQAFLDILPTLSLEQIDKLIDVLENKYLDLATKSEDNKFIEKLKQIQDEFTQNIEKNDLETLNKLKELEDILDSKK